MIPETKKYLLLGGGLIAATVIGIVVYKKYEANSQASQAASDQSTQDQLAYIESMALSGGPYAQDGGAVSSAITLPSAPAMPSLVDQISQLETAFGLAPTAPVTPSAGAASSGGSGTAAAPSSPTTVTPKPAAGSPAADYLPHGATNWLPSGVRSALNQEGILVS